MTVFYKNKLCEGRDNGIHVHFIIIIIIIIIPRGKFGSAYLGKATTAERAALPIPSRVCGIFLCPDNGMAAGVWDFLTCTHMLMQAIAQGGCADTLRESALVRQGFEPSSVLRLAFRSDALRTEPSRP